MSYHITIDYRPGGKYPFAMNTEADQIPLTRAELESLKFQCECALMESSVSFSDQIKIIPIKEIKDERTRQAA